MTKMEPLPLFYSVNRFLKHDERTGVGSVIGNLQSSVNRQGNVPVEYSRGGYEEDSKNLGRVRARYVRICFSLPLLSLATGQY
jgi:hypothetical protein